MSEHTTFKIGITDSGFGGLSMVAQFQRFYPEVEIIYFADLKNSPYGEKQKSQVQKLVQECADLLLVHGVAAILLACNTATSVAVESLRTYLSIPVFGMEPAIKPALASSEEEKVLVLATPLTLKEDRFLSLKNKVDPMNRVIAVSCPGLSELIDQQRIQDAIQYVQDIISEQDLENVHSVVLGCTHYIFLKNKLQELNPQLHFYDGNSGTLNHIANTFHLSKDIKLKSNLTQKPRWKFITNIDQSKNEEIAVSWMNQFQNQNFTRAI